MLHLHQILPNESITWRLLDDLGRILQARRAKVVLADAATQGFFAFAAANNPILRASLDTSLVINSAHSLKAVLGVDIGEQPMDQLAPTIGVEIARNALDLSQASLAIAMTQCSSKHLSLPNCAVLGLHWWYKEQQESGSSWMLSHQFVVASTREELPAKFVQIAVQETIKVLRLQEPVAA